MGVNILILLLIWSNLVKKCMAVCAITPDSNGHVTIPDDWSGLVNGTIPSSAFQSCWQLKSVTIPHSVTSIDTSAFRSCFNLQSVNIPDSVTSVGDNAFKGCSYLSTLVLESALFNGATVMDSYFSDSRRSSAPACC